LTIAWEYDPLRHSWKARHGDLVLNVWKGKTGWRWGVENAVGTHGTGGPALSADAGREAAEAAVLQGNLPLQVLHNLPATETGSP